MKEQIRNLFINRTEPLRAIYENLSNTFYSNIPEYVEGNLRNSFGIPIEDDILFFRDTSIDMSGNQGLAITTSSIYWNMDNSVENNTYYSNWNQFLSAEYQDMNIYLIYYDGSSYALDISLFFAGNFQIDHAQYFASVLSEIANLCQPDETPDEAKERIEELMNAQNYSKAEAACNAYQESHGYDLWVGMQQTTIALQQGDNERGLQEAEQVYNTIREQYGEDPYGENPWPPIAGDVLAAISYFKQQAGNYEMARFFAFYSVEFSEPSKKDIRRKQYEEFNRLYSENFLNIDIERRRLLLLVKEISNLNSNTDQIAVLEMQHIGSDLHFPTTHPVPNKLYIVHPCNSSRYVPFDDYELDLLKEKQQEFCRIAQCLGATELSIESEDGRSRSSALRRELILTRHFNPTQTPFVPDDWLWFDCMSSWIWMATQRLQGVLIEHVEEMSSQYINYVTASLPKPEVIREDFMQLIGVDGNLGREMEKVFEEKANVSYSIHVKFAPISVQYTAIAKEVISLPQQSDSSKTTAEQEYLTAYKECLANNGGEFSDSERRLLERMRKSLGISVKRAAELEDSLTPALQLTEAESEYLEEYKLCAAEGSITDSERRLLNRMRKTLGISDERAIEIESSINY